MDEYGHTSYSECVNIEFLSKKTIFAPAQLQVSRVRIWVSMPNMEANWSREECTKRERRKMIMVRWRFLATERVEEELRNCVKRVALF
jgi:hypothetical protein